ncbi:uncharacterized protein [Diadema setosum]|uniref:uncharacterized protein n=1 Tax=Diadema setosum TaxID=31175 RepID=UPI003B3A57F9
MGCIFSKCRKERAKGRSEDTTISADLPEPRADGQQHPSLTIIKSASEEHRGDEFWQPPYTELQDEGSHYDVISVTSSSSSMSREGVCHHTLDVKVMCPTLSDEEAARKMEIIKEIAELQLRDLKRAERTFWQSVISREAQKVAVALATSEPINDLKDQTEIATSFLKEQCLDSNAKGQEHLQAPQTDKTNEPNIPTDASAEKTIIVGPAGAMLDSNISQIILHGADRAGHKTGANESLFTVVTDIKDPLPVDDEIPVWRQVPSSVAEEVTQPPQAADRWPDENHEEEEEEESGALSEHETSRALDGEEEMEQSLYEAGTGLESSKEAGPSAEITVDPDTTIASPLEATPDPDDAPNITLTTGQVMGLDLKKDEMTAEIAIPAGQLPSNTDIPAVLHQEELTSESRSNTTSAHAAVDSEPLTSDITALESSDSSRADQVSQTSKSPGTSPSDAEPEAVVNTSPKEVEDPGEYSGLAERGQPKDTVVDLSNTPPTPVEESLGTESFPDRAPKICEDIVHILGKDDFETVLKKNKVVVKSRIPVAKSVTTKNVQTRKDIAPSSPTRKISWAGTTKIPVPRRTNSTRAHQPTQFSSSQLKRSVVNIKTAVTILPVTEVPGDTEEQEMIETPIESPSGVLQASSGPDGPKDIKVVENTSLVQAGAKDHVTDDTKTIEKDAASAVSQVVNDLIDRVVGIAEMSRKGSVAPSRPPTSTKLANTSVKAHTQNCNPTESRTSTSDSCGRSLTSKIPVRSKPNLRGTHREPRASNERGKWGDVDGAKDGLHRVGEERPPVDGEVGTLIDDQGVDSSEVQHDDDPTSTVSEILDNVLDMVMRKITVVRTRIPIPVRCRKEATTTTHRGTDLPKEDSFLSDHLVTSKTLMSRKSLLPRPVRNSPLYQPARPPVDAREGGRSSLTRDDHHLSSSGAIHSWTKSKLTCKQRQIGHRSSVTRKIVAEPWIDRADTSSPSNRASSLYPKSKYTPLAIARGTKSTGNARSTIRSTSRPTPLWQPSVRGVVPSRRVPSVYKRIPAFKGTTGMDWESALRFVIQEDVKHHDTSVYRRAVRQSYVTKMIAKIEADEAEEARASALRKKEKEGVEVEQIELDTSSDRQNT